MKVFILTDNGHVPYEGGHTTILGLFSTKDNAVEYMKAVLKTDNFQQYATDEYNKAVFVDGLPIPDLYGDYKYYDNYDSNWFSIEEHDLDNPTTL